MAYEHKPGSFTLFRNDKDGVEKRPDYRGEGADLDGSPIEVAAWIKKTDKATFMSCTFKKKEAKETKGSSKAEDDDIPFAPVHRGIKGHAY